MQRLAIVAAGIAVLSFAASTPRPVRRQLPHVQVDTAALLAHAKYLASDALLGRGNGTPGQTAAAAYIASELERLGAEPVPSSSSFLQPFTLQHVRLDSAATQLSIRSGSGAKIFSLENFTLRGGRRAAYRPFGATGVFIGPIGNAAALVAGGASLRGKVAVAAPGGEHFGESLAALDAQNIAALLYVVPNEGAYRRTRDLSQQLFQYVVQADVHGPSGLHVPFVVVGPAVARELGIGPADTASMRDPRDLNATITLSIRAREETLKTANVVGWLPGRDRALSDQYVVLQAHYDHLGVSTPVDGDSIYNGFMDDAVGVAAVLTAARALADSARVGHLARSVLLLLPAAEEPGALGSSYYVDHPLAPLRNAVATVTIDLPTPLAPAKRWVLETNDSALVASLRPGMALRGWTVEGAPALPNSDHLSWIARNIPSLFVVADEGWEGVSRAREDSLIASWWRPHLPSDQWRPDFPVAGLARQTEFLLLTALALANRP